MKNKYTWGRWLVVLGIFLVIALFIWLTVDERLLVRWFVRYGRVFAGVALIILVALAIALPRRRQFRHVLQQDSREQGLEPPQPSASQKNSQLQQEGYARIAALRSLLSDHHGLRWRYRDRWLMLVGEESLVRRLVPGLVETGYAVAGNAVLLYAKQQGDQFDTHWLKQIRRLRRRPVDAMVAVVQAKADSRQPFDAGELIQRLSRHAHALRWAAPLYLLGVTESRSDLPDRDEAIGCFWPDARASSEEMGQSLRQLVGELAEMGTMRVSVNPADSYSAELSKWIEQQGAALLERVQQIGRFSVWRNGVRGIFFVPLLRPRALRPEPELEPGAPPAETAASVTEAPEKINGAPGALWQAIAGCSRYQYGRRVGFVWQDALVWGGVGLASLWVIGTMVSGFANRSAIGAASRTIAALSATSNGQQAAQALNALDTQINTLEIHAREGAPWTTRFGLNRDRALRTALWRSYGPAAGRVLAGSLQAQLEFRLRQLVSLSDAEIAGGGSQQVQDAYDTLKTYLMLARPAHADPAFLTPRLVALDVPGRPSGATLSPGAWDDLRRRLIEFYASHSGHGANGVPAIVPDTALVAAARQTLISVRGIENSTDVLYQQILDDAKPRYPSVTLVSLLGDSAGSLTGSAGSSAGGRGLFGTTQTVPGVYTREAWEGHISQAIDDASRTHTIAGDWVLTDSPVQHTVPDSLRDQLRQRYFDDYARAWEQFLNTVRWQPAPNLSGTVDQLTLLSDPQRSPLLALMKSVVWQAQAGVPEQSLSDSLLSKARQLTTGTAAQDPSKQATQPGAPLAGAFGPLLRFAGADAPAPPASGQTARVSMAVGDLNLSRYIERVSAMRLKLQQIMQSADPNATSRVAAQAVLQGKASDIADSRDYGSRVAASFGQQWAGFGGLFEAPLNETWSRILQPAAASLNETWRTAVVVDWNRTFGGRYPFADSDNDASLPDMARFMRPDTGVITQFVSTQLAGVVERQGDHWGAVENTGRGNLTVDPAFLAGLNRLMRVSTVLFASGDARIRFDLSGAPTAGITSVKISLAGRDFEYFNQKVEWEPFVWPDNSLDGGISHVEWQTEQGGLRTALDAQGRFGPVRLFEKARVTQLDNARYRLTWSPDQSTGVALNVQLRSDAGAGPLDVLRLRHFTLPQRIFVVNDRQVQAGTVSSGPPPLPPAALEAAKHASVGLPEEP